MAHTLLVDGQLLCSGEPGSLEDLFQTLTDPARPSSARLAQIEQRFFTEQQWVVLHPGSEVVLWDAKAGHGLRAGKIPQHANLLRSETAVALDHGMPDVPGDWIVFTSTRPLLGHRTLENADFLRGRFRAAVDPADGELAERYIAENRKLAANVVVTGSREELLAMALLGSRYRDQYLGTYQGEELWEAFASQVNDLSRYPLGELLHRRQRLQSDEKGLLEAVRANLAGQPAVADQSVEQPLIDAEPEPSVETSGRAMHLLHLAVAELSATPQVQADMSGLAPEEMIERFEDFPTPNAMQPAAVTTLPLGSVRTLPYGELDERHVEVLVELPVDELVLSEHEDMIRKHPTFARYVEMARAGHEPPPISVAVSDDGQLVSRNRRRVLAAKEAGLKTLKAWVSPLNSETGLPLKYGELRELVSTALSASADPSPPPQSEAVIDSAVETAVQSTPIASTAQAEQPTAPAAAQEQPASKAEASMDSAAPRKYIDLDDDEEESSGAGERHRGVVLVPMEEMAAFDKKLEALNKKAERFGLEPVKINATTTDRYYKAYEYVGSEQDFLSISHHKLKKGEVPPHGEEVVEFNRIDLDYPIIKLGDWQVVAKIEAFTPKENLIFTVTRDPMDNATAEEHRNCGVGCQHCNTKRARNESFLLRNTADGQYKEVGSTCLQDFTGINPAAVLFLAQLQELVNLSAEFDPESGSGFGRPTAYSTEGYLARVAFCVEQGGWVSSAKAREQGIPATYEEAQSVDRWLANDKAMADAFFANYERHKTTARQAMAWYAEKEPRDSFDRNVKALLGEEFIAIDRKHLAFAAAAVPGYLRHVSEQVDKESQKPSEYIGEIGDKKEMPLTVVGVSPFNTQYGTSYRVNMRDADGNRLTWKASNPPQDLIENNAVGRPFNAKFTVKELEEYKGERITAVTRLKFEGWCEPTLEERSDQALVGFVEILGITPAFQSNGHREEARNVLLRAAEQLADWDQLDPLKLVDSDGLEVGTLQAREHYGYIMPYGTGDNGKITLAFPLVEEASDLLRGIANDQLLTGKEAHDLNIYGPNKGLIGGLHIAAPHRPLEIEITDEESVYAALAAAYAQKRAEGLYDLYSRIQQQHPQFAGVAEEVFTAMAPLFEQDLGPAGEAARKLLRQREISKQNSEEANHAVGRNDAAPGGSAPLSGAEGQGSGQEPERDQPAGAAGEGAREDFEVAGTADHPEVEQRIRASIAALPAAAQEWASLRDHPVVVRFRSEGELASMPARLAESLRKAAAVTVNKGRIEVINPDVPEGVLSHELAHMAFDDLPEALRTESRQLAIADGAKVVAMARRRKDVPEELAMYQTEVRSYINRVVGKAREGVAALDGSLEFGLMLPSSGLGHFAKAAGIEVTDEQYVELCLHLWAADQQNLDFDTQNTREEDVAYRAGVNAEFANRVFQAAVDGRHAKLQAKADQEQRAQLSRLHTAVEHLLEGKDAAFYFDNPRNAPEMRAQAEAVRVERERIVSALEAAGYTIQELALLSKADEAARAFGVELVPGADMLPVLALHMAQIGQYAPLQVGSVSDQGADAAPEDHQPKALADAIGTAIEQRLDGNVTLVAQGNPSINSLGNFLLVFREALEQAVVDVLVGADQLHDASQILADALTPAALEAAGRAFIERNYPDMAQPNPLIVTFGTEQTSEANVIRDRNAWMERNIPGEQLDLQRDEEGVGYITLDRGNLTVEHDPIFGSSAKGQLATQRLVYQMNDGRLTYWEMASRSFIAVDPADARLALYKPVVTDAEAEQATHESKRMYVGASTRRMTLDEAQAHRNWLLNQEREMRELERNGKTQFERDTGLRESAKYAAAAREFIRDLNATIRGYPEWAGRTGDRQEAAGTQTSGEPAETQQEPLQVAAGHEPWRTSIRKARQYATELGLPTKGRSLETLIAAIEQYQNPPQMTEGMLLGEGDVVLTVTGRRTTPFPAINSGSNRAANKTEKTINQWLMQNALDEAEARGDEFNVRTFRAALDNPQQVDKDSAEMYLTDPAMIFPAQRPFLKPLVPEGSLASAEPEPHYSQLILRELVANHGWTRSAIVDGIEKNVGGGRRGQMINPEGDRVLIATFSGQDRQRYVSVKFGAEEWFDMDGREVLGRPEDVPAFAKRLDERAMQMAIDTAEDKSTLKVSGNQPAGFSEQELARMIVISADSVEALRRVDVDRVLNQSSTAEQQLALGAYIAGHRADLAEEVLEVSLAIGDARGWQLGIEAASEPAGTGIDREQLARDFTLRRTEVIEALRARGIEAKLIQLAGGKGFAGLPISEQAAAYVKLVEQGAEPVEFAEDYNTMVRRLGHEAAVRRKQTERTITQANGKPFNSEGSARRELEKFELGMTHEIARQDGGYVLRLLSPAAQHELRNKAAGIESYTEAQAVILREMGIGETADGEIDATEEQWAEIERRTENRLREQRGLLPLPAPAATSTVPDSEQLSVEEIVRLYAQDGWRGHQFKLRVLAKPLIEHGHLDAERAKAVWTDEAALSTLVEELVDREVAQKFAEPKEQSTDEKLTDNQGRDLAAVKRHMDYLTDLAEEGRERSAAVFAESLAKVPMPEWTEVNGVKVLRAGQSRYVGVPLSGREVSARFDIIDVESEEYVTQLTGKEVRGWLRRTALAEVEQAELQAAADVAPYDYDSREKTIKARLAELGWTGDYYPAKGDAVISFERVMPEDTWKSVEPIGMRLKVVKGSGAIVATVVTDDASKAPELIADEVDKAAAVVQTLTTVTPSPRAEMAKRSGEAVATLEESEFGPRIEAMLESLRDAGEQGESMAAAIEAGLRADLKNGRLTEEGVAFREQKAHEELAKINNAASPMPVEFKPFTMERLAVEEPSFIQLPREISAAAIAKLNHLGAQLAQLGFGDYLRVDATAPKAAIDLADQMRDVASAIMHLGPARYRIAKGYIEAKQSKLDRFEDFASEQLDIDTRSYPGIRTNAVLTTGGVRQAPSRLNSANGQLDFSEEPVGEPAATVSARAQAGSLDVSTVTGQKELANRAATIASLKMMNGQIRTLAPDEAWDDLAIEEAADLDALRDAISTALVNRTRGIAPQEAPEDPFRERLESASGQDLRKVFDKLNLAGERMTHSERVEVLLVEDREEVEAALDAVMAEDNAPIAPGSIYQALKQLPSKQLGTTWLGSGQPKQFALRMLPGTNEMYRVDVSGTRATIRPYDIVDRNQVDQPIIAQVDWHSGHSLEEVAGMIDAATPSSWIMVRDAERPWLWTEGPATQASIFSDLASHKGWLIDSETDSVPFVVYMVPGSIGMYRIDVDGDQAIIRPYDSIPRNQAEQMVIARVDLPAALTTREAADLIRAATPDTWNLQRKPDQPAIWVPDEELVESLDGEATPSEDQYVSNQYNSYRSFIRDPDTALSELSGGGLAEHISTDERLLTGESEVLLATLEAIIKERAPVEAYREEYRKRDKRAEKIGRAKAEDEARSSLAGMVTRREFGVSLEQFFERNPVIKAKSDAIKDWLNGVPAAGAVNAEAGPEAVPAPEVTEKPDAGVNHRPAFQPMTEAKVLYLSVSPEEWEQILLTGKVGIGGVNPEHGRADEIFFADDIRAPRMLRGSDLYLRAKALVLQEGLARELKEANHKLTQAHLNLSERAQQLGYYDLDEVPHTDDVLVELAAKHQSLQDALDQLHRDGEIKIAERARVLDAEDAARGYSAVVLETHPLDGGNVYSGADSMRDDVGYGFPGGALTLEHISHIHYVDGATILSSEVLSSPKAESAASPAEAEEVKWFGTQEKADSYIAKKGLEATHEVVPNGRRFEIHMLAAAESAPLTRSQSARLTLKSLRSLLAEATDPQEKAEIRAAMKRVLPTAAQADLGGDSPSRLPATPVASGEADEEEESLERIEPVQAEEKVGVSGGEGIAQAERPAREQFWLARSAFGGFNLRNAERVCLDVVGSRPRHFESEDDARHWAGQYGIEIVGAPVAVAAKMAADAEKLASQAAMIRAAGERYLTRTLKHLESSAGLFDAPASPQLPITLDFAQAAEYLALAWPELKNVLGDTGGLVNLLQEATEAEVLLSSTRLPLNEGGDVEERGRISRASVDALAIRLLLAPAAAECATLKQIDLLWGGDHYAVELQKPVIETPRSELVALIHAHQGRDQRLVERFCREHEMLVQFALQQELEVAGAVLADYPHLSKLAEGGDIDPSAEAVKAGVSAPDDNDQQERTQPAAPPTSSDGAYWITERADGKFIVENEESVIGASGGLGERTFAAHSNAMEWATQNGIGIVVKAGADAIAQAQEPDAGDGDFAAQATPLIADANQRYLDWDWERKQAAARYAAQKFDEAYDPEPPLLPNTFSLTKAAEYMLVAWPDLVKQLGKAGLEQTLKEAAESGALEYAGVRKLKGLEYKSEAAPSGIGRRDTAYKTFQRESVDAYAAHLLLAPAASASNEQHQVCVMVDGQHFAMALEAPLFTVPQVEFAHRLTYEHEQMGWPAGEAAHQRVFDAFLREHDKQVQDALQQGSPVPDKVLVDYPALVRSDLSPVQVEQMLRDVEESAGCEASDRMRAIREWQPGITAGKELETLPVFGSIEDARAWVMARRTQLGLDQHSYTTTDEYQNLKDQVRSLSHAATARSPQRFVELMAEVGTVTGDRVSMTVPTPAGEQTFEGTVIDKAGMPFVRLDAPMPVTKASGVASVSEMRWDSRWTKVGGTAAAQEAAVPAPGGEPITTQSELWRALKACWDAQVSDSFICGQQFPAVLNVKGAERRFALWKDSGAGPLKFMVLGDSKHGKQFDFFALTRDGRLEHTGTKNLWALTDEARAMHLADFEAVFAPKPVAAPAEVAEQAPAHALTAIEMPSLAEAEWEAAADEWQQASLWGGDDGASLQVAPGSGARGR